MSSKKRDKLKKVEKVAKNGRKKDAISKMKKHPFFYQILKSYLLLCREKHHYSRHNVVIETVVL
jgi:hypothetical protein